MLVGQGYLVKQFGSLRDMQDWVDNRANIDDILLQYPPNYFAPIVTGDETSCAIKVVCINPISPFTEMILNDLPNRKN
jgi:hypothetical protein